MNPTISPAAAWNETSVSAASPPKRFETFSRPSRIGASPWPFVWGVATSATSAATVAAIAGAASAPFASMPLVAPSRNTDRNTSGRSRSSAVGPLNRISPFSMKYACSAIVSARLTDCSTRMMVVPCAEMSCTIGSNCSTIAGARPSESSSIISNRGRSMNAIPSASICCWPPERFPAGSSSRFRNTGKSSSTCSVASVDPRLLLAVQPAREA